MMSSDEMAGKKAAVETNIRGLPGNNYRKASDGLESSGNAAGGGGLEMSDEGERGGSLGREEVNGQVLEEAIGMLEGGKKWYSYLTTKEFWFVLLLGYVIFCSPRPL